MVKLSYDNRAPTTVPVKAYGAAATPHSSSLFCGYRARQPDMLLNSEGARAWMTFADVQGWQAVAGCRERRRILSDLIGDRGQAGTGGGVC